MAFTPLLKPLNLNGTTFYTFSSAAKDLSKCIANSQKEFVFSHFVCIDIPNFINTRNGVGNSSSAVPTTTDRNYFQFNGIQYSYGIDDFDQATKSTSKKLADHLQDYVFNLEEKLISDSTDNGTDRSVAERVFWHWMKETCAMNWKFDSSKIAPALQHQNSARFIEGCDDIANYGNVVKYIGAIDITNNVDIAQEAYTEIYIHIPSEAGCTPTVLFKEEFDGNFSANGVYEVSTNEAWILGQNGPDTSNPLDLRAIYDTQYGASNKRYLLADEVAYNTQPVTTLTDPSTNPDTYGYKTQIDGLCIDFETNSYNDIVANNIPNMDEFNKLGNSFEFNAVLVYYDIVDRSSGERTSNLYGILFLDDVKSVNPGWDFFQRYPKYKPVAGMQNGNSYGFKLNLRIDIEPDKNGITTLVNEYNTFSMGLFSDAMTKMQECAEMFVRTREKLSNLESRMSDIETIMTTLSNHNELVSEIENLKQSLENANLAFADRSSLLDLISHVSDNVNSIISGRANVELQYNTDVIKPGYGTEIDTSTPNQVKINSKNYGYNITVPTRYDNSSISEASPLDLANPNDTYNTVNAILKSMTNMIRIHTENAASSPIHICIDSSYTPWKSGQNIRIVFPNLDLNSLNNNDIQIITSNNTINIPFNDLIGNNPIIELICLDFESDKFVYDIIR